MEHDGGCGAPILVVLLGQHMEGTLETISVLFHVIFDTCAQLLFVSCQLVERLHLEKCIVMSPLSVKSLLGCSTRLIEVSRHFLLYPGGKIYSAYLLVMGFRGFQLILMLNWMHPNHISRDTVNRGTGFHPPR